MTRLELSLVLVLVGLFLVPMADAKWIAFDRTGRTPALDTNGSYDSVSITVSVPGIDLSQSEGYTTVTIPGQAHSMLKGYPELPVITTSLILPDGATPRVSIQVLDSTEIDLPSKVLPSRGHMTRDVDPSTVPLIESDIYKKDAFYPSDKFISEMGHPYILRDFRGAALRFSPVVYNPVTGKLRVVKKARIDIVFNKTSRCINRKVRSGHKIDADFASIYKALFANFDAVAKAAGDIDENAGRAVIICPDKFLEAMAPLQEWRATKGLESKLVATSELVEGDRALTAEDVKNFIQAEYDAGNLTFVLLVGDTDTMPTLRGENEGAKSDACYVKCEGSDEIPDAFISRFSAKTIDEVKVQVARAIAYEKDPVTGEAAAFYHRAVGIASNQGSPMDKERAEWLRDALLEGRYDVVDQIYDPSASKSKIAKAVNEGRGIINYIGHGSKTMWVTSRFNTSDVEDLQNGEGKWPMIWSVACVNGDFAYGSDCFCEAWAKQGTPDNPMGAIGMVGASTNMSWVPPCDWQNAIVIDYHLPMIVNTGGAQHYYGLLKACEKWGTDSNSEGVKLIEQCVYFGDCSVVLRSDIPRTPEIAVNEQTGDRSLKLTVTAEGKPVRSARVVVATELQGYSVAVTNEEGVAELDFAEGLSGVETVAVTVTGPNLVPVIQQQIDL